MTARPKESNDPKPGDGAGSQLSRGCQVGRSRVGAPWRDVSTCVVAHVLSRQDCSTQLAGFGYGGGAMR